jgi:hypothetical protein
MTAEQAVQNIASGIENSFKTAIRIELEKQAKPIIEAAAERLARGIVAKIDSMTQYDPFTKTVVLIRIDGVEKTLNQQESRHAE